jgi:alpha-glucosidase
MFSRKLTAAILLASLGLASPPAGAQQKSVDALGHPWWQHAVFYEIYPRSFADSNNDGIGDLNGIASRMDYLKELGVDAIWITPCFPSPQVDFGYDVSDYEAIDPMYGTMKDFDHLVSEGKKRGINVILDFVVNHTSDQHKWFLDSKSSRTSGHRDWYIWRDGKGPGQPPNNWLSTFGLSAWKLDLLPLFLSRTAGPELAQSRRGKSHARRDALLVQAWRRRVPPRRRGHPLRRSQSHR